MKKIAITGANGYLASLIQKTNKENFHFIPVTRSNVDLTDPKKTAAYFEKLDFDLVFHTAARTQTADCESNPEATKRINTESAIKIAEICQRKKARFVFLSTEQVFNNAAEKGPFSEVQETNSSSVYGRQKIEVEQFLLNNSSDYLILRLSWMMGLSSPGIKESPNIIKKVMQALFYQKPAVFTVNEVRGLTYAKRLTDAFETILQLPTDTYHFSSTNNLSSYEAAKLIGKKLGFSKEKIQQYILPDDQRYTGSFRDLRLDTNKIQEKGISIFSFEEDIDTCLKEFNWGSSHGYGEGERIG
ncbi:sugar nucleotide-binding protein [Enterococcus sp. BWB1-3]|uniref:SDR family oxidoreductase n=1 Tax=Enterococcus sp. BWB1-3 TaxID=2787713 RepID=UPI001920E4EE|nr:sugar nucleotide-binding protein [Enterococcus sp. BWB1-3]MBL1229672.1 sugar nucleotide-binding protein [Enterococcus sp. BWB1-3]